MNGLARRKFGLNHIRVTRYASHSPVGVAARGTANVSAGLDYG